MFQKSTSMFVAAFFAFGLGQVSLETANADQQNDVTAEILANRSKAAAAGVAAIPQGAFPQAAILNDSLSFDYSQLSVYQKLVSILTVQDRIDKYLIGPGNPEAVSLRKQIKVATDQIEIFARGGPVAEYAMQLNQVDLPVPEFTYTPPGVGGVPPNFAKPLAGLKIAIDPGHMGGKGCPKLSGLDIPDVTKCYDLRSVDSRSLKAPGIDFGEGDLSMRTALLIKQRLEKYGATVFLTREEAGRPVFPKTFLEWRQDAQEVRRATLDHLLNIRGFGGTEAEVIEYMNNTSKLRNDVYMGEDLRHGARLINAFQPHLSFVIHFNAAGSGLQTGPNFTNGNLTFLPGGFEGPELGTQASRFDFMRLAVSGTVEKSAKACQLLTANLNHKLFGKGGAGGVPVQKASLGGVDSRPVEGVARDDGPAREVSAYDVMTQTRDINDVLAEFYPSFVERHLVREDFSASGGKSSLLDSWLNSDIGRGLSPEKSDGLNQEIYWGKTDTPSVYTRNLALTRMIRGPMCYGESLFMDHPQEAPLLNQEVMIDGVLANPRLSQVADAYVSTVFQYVGVQEPHAL